MLKLYYRTISGSNNNDNNNNNNSYICMFHIHNCSLLHLYFFES